MTYAMIMGSSLEDSPMTNFLMVNISAKFQSKHGERARAPNERGVGKIGNFWPISCRISETVQDRTIVTLTD